MLDNIEILQQPSLPKGLDEAAEESCVKAFPYIDEYHEYDRHKVDDAREDYKEGFKAGAKYFYEQAEKDLLAIVKEYMEKGERCMQQSYEDREQGEYTFWDGFHNCAENILRELEK
jgi:hypothetical protein